MPKTISSPIQSSSLRNRLGLISGPLLFFILLLMPISDGLSAEGQAVLATTVWMAIWWISEAAPLAVTALLPVVLFPVTGGLEAAATTSAFGQPIIFLFLGGFVIALAMEQWNLHRRIAISIVLSVGDNPARMILGFMLATALLSMWISNTATALMMMPIGTAIIQQFREGAASDQSERFGKMLMLSIAYSASIGGMATLIGTPTNAIFVAIVKQLFDVEISFAKWMLIVLPISSLLLGVCWYYLTKITYPIQLHHLGGGKEEIRRMQDELGPMSREEKYVLAVFTLTAICWITRSLLLVRLLPGLNDTAIAIAGGIALFLIPARTRQSPMLMTWKDTTQLPWGILLLFGSGLTIAAGFRSSGLAQWIGEQLTAIGTIELLLIILIVVAMINFLTEITSNVATASVMLPILASLSVAIGVHPYGMMLGACVAASCAFMLPVATPPNAVVFGSGLVTIRDMSRTGLWMNLISVVLLTLFVYYLFPLIWDIDLQVLPDAFRTEVSIP